MRYRLLILTVLLIGLSVTVNLAQDSTIHTVDSATLPGLVSALGTDIVPNLAHSKLDAHLFQLNQEYITYLNGGSGGTFETNIRHVTVLDDDFITVDFIARGDADQLLLDLQALGLQNGVLIGRLISGRLPISAIGQLEALDNLQHARYPLAGVSNAGSVPNQANQAMAADNARTIYGVDGSGLIVGILSDSFDCSSSPLPGSYAADVASGDLPNGVNLVDDSLCGTDYINEGRAMAQLIYDVAPASNFAFHTAFNGQADFAQGIHDLVTAGSDVIVDDVFYYAEPVFQDGVIAQAADSVAMQGTPYFAAAGNLASFSYEDDFRYSGQTFNHGGKIYLLHDFDPGAGVDVLLDFTMPNNTWVDMVFQWDEPFASAGGMGAGSDMDLFLVNSTFTTAYQWTTTNNVGGDAYEFLSYGNSGSAANFAFALGVVYTDPMPTRIKLIDYAWQQTYQYPFTSATITPHARLEFGAGVGAAFYQQTPYFGVNPPIAETFTALGGTQVYFDTGGNRFFPPQDRMQPRFTAPDGTNTTFFYPGVDPEPDGAPNFFGTSAAAPHAAAVATLMLDYDGTLTPCEINYMLESSAIDMHMPGFDYLTGFGLIKADHALGLVQVAALDVNDDGIVTPVDAVFVVNRLGLPPIGNDAPADVNFDGLIDNLDVQDVMMNFGLTP